jgi:hypothetical protein
MNASPPPPSEPQPPRPESFGLTVERVRELANPGWVYWFISWPMPTAGAITAATVFLSTGEVGTSVVAFFGGMFAPFIGLSMAEWVWRRTQKDSGALRQYDAAIEAFRPIHQQWGRQNSEWERTQLAWWSALGPRRFEIELASLLERRGLKVQWTGRAGDGGVDISADDGRGVIIIQCKAHAKPIGPGPVRDLFGTLNHCGAREAWIVSIAGFSAAAQRFSEGKPIRLRTIGDILREN